VDGLPAMQESEGLEMCKFLRSKTQLREACVFGSEYTWNLPGFSNTAIFSFELPIS
jgi:hypothetical protein